MVGKVMSSGASLASGRKKSSLKKLIKRMDPAVREAFLQEERQAEMSSHIHKRDNGKYNVDLYISKDQNGNYESANADKEFDSMDDAMVFVKGFFETNPEMNNEVE